MNVPVFYTSDKVEMKGEKFQTLLVYFFKRAIAVSIIALLFAVLKVGFERLFYNKDGFEGQTDVAQMMRNLQEASGKLGDDKSYNLWIGYMYKHPQDAADVLNDFKKRVFQPSCQFRQDWDTNLPAGKSRPMAAENSEIANIAYKTYIDCLANNSEGCILSLDDARERFMEPGCAFLNPSDTDSYMKDYKPVFKAAAKK